MGEAEARALQAATPLDVEARAFPFSAEVPALPPPALLCLAGLLVGLAARLRA